MIKARAPLLWRAPASRLINLESEVARAKSQRMDVVRVHEKLYRFLHLVGCEVGGGWQAGSGLEMGTSPEATGKSACSRSHLALQEPSSAILAPAQTVRPARHRC